MNDNFPTKKSCRFVLLDGRASLVAHTAVRKADSSVGKIVVARGKIYFYKGELYYNLHDIDIKVFLNSRFRRCCWI